MRRDFEYRGLGCPCRCRDGSSCVAGWREWKLARSGYFWPGDQDLGGVWWHLHSRYPDLREEVVC